MTKYNFFFKPTSKALMSADEDFHDANANLGKKNSLYLIIFNSQTSLFSVFFVPVFHPF